MSEEKIQKKLIILCTSTLSLRRTFRRILTYYAMVNLHGV